MLKPNSRFVLRMRTTKKSDLTPFDVDSNGILVDKVPKAPKKRTTSVDSKRVTGDKANGEKTSKNPKDKIPKPQPSGESHDSDKGKKATEGQQGKKQPDTTGNGVAYPLVSKERVFRRQHSASPEVIKELKTRFPDWAFYFGTERPHDHPVGAAERAICEQLVYEEIHRKFGNVQITDIGGSAARHLRNGRTDVHSCNPIISSSDVMRRSNNPPGADFCHEKSLDCERPVDVYMSIHSLYYLTPLEVLRHLMRSKCGSLYAVVHRFNDLYGGLHVYNDTQEAEYETFVEDNQLLVRMNVKGNFVGYTHDPCHWLNSTCFHDPMSTTGMSWTGRPIGDSWIIEFKLVENSRSLLVDTYQALSLVNSLKRNDHYGHVGGVMKLGDESKFKPMLEMLKITVNNVHSFGGYMWLAGRTTRHVLVPKSIVEQVAIKMIGLPRNKDSLKQCINYMKLAVNADKLSIPASMRADCVIHGSALAFILFVEEEIQSFNKLCTPNRMALYNALSWVLRMDHIRPFFSCCRDTGRDDTNLTVQSYNATRASVPSSAFDAARAWPVGLPGYESNRPLATIRPGAKMKYASREKVEDKPAFYAVCTTFSNYIPLVPTPSINNETVAIANRALMETPEPSQETWDKLEKFSAKFVRRFKKIDPTDPDRDFELWNSKFPKARALNQAKAYESLKSEPLNGKDYIRKSFSKKELTMKGGPEPSDFDPRAIQGNSDRFNSAYGPFTSKVSEQLKAMWHINARITYTCGMTSEEIGTWRDQFGDEDVLILECDESRYDCHQRKRVQEFYESVEKRAGSSSYPNVAAAIKGCRTVFGYTSKGVKYSVTYTMTSGVAKTSSSNSFVNGTKTTFIITEINGFKCWMLVNGDDNIVVLRGTFSPEKVKEIVDSIRTVGLELGFETKVKSATQWSQVEYCSSLFWPTDSGTVLGPKIGKRLPKIGFSLNPLKPELVKGMLIGLQVECGFVPVLRTYAQHQLSLVANLTAKTYHDKERRHKSLPTSAHCATQATYDFFFERYGVAYDLCESSLLESLTDNLTDCVDYSLLETFTNVDL